MFSSFISNLSLFHTMQCTIVQYLIKSPFLHLLSVHCGPPLPSIRSELKSGGTDFEKPLVSFVSVSFCLFAAMSCAKESCAGPVLVDDRCQEEAALEASPSTYESLSEMGSGRPSTYLSVALGEGSLAVMLDCDGSCENSCHTIQRNKFSCENGLQVSLRQVSLA